MTFIESQLAIGINYGASYGPRFSTGIVAQSDGGEQRRIEWQQPLIMANLAEIPVTGSELDYLLTFHAAVKGAANGFRLKDWSDYKAIGQVLGTGNGSAQTWQLTKTYTAGGASVTRPITKPVSGTVKVYVNGVLQNSNWSVNTATGAVSTTLSGALTCDFEFDVPVRFEQDKIDFSFDAYQRGTGYKLFKMNALTCTEIRLEPTIYPPLDAIPASLSGTFDLGFDYGTVGGPKFQTNIVTTASEFEDRKSFWNNPLGEWNIGGRGLIRSELDYLIAWFRICRGRAVPFTFKDWQDEILKLVRFSEDRISFRFDAYRSTDEQVIFDLGGIAVKEIVPYIPPVCTPKTVNFSNALTSAWSVIDAKTTGIYTGASYNVNTSGGYWRTTLLYNDNTGVGYAAYIEWSNSWSYTPSFNNEIINLSFSVDYRFVSYNYFSGILSFPLTLVARQGSNSVSLAVDCGHPNYNTDWVNYSATGSFSTFTVGIPITFSLIRSNSNPPGDMHFPQDEVITDIKNVVLTVNVTCS